MKLEVSGTLNLEDSEIVDYQKWLNDAKKPTGGGQDSCMLSRSSAEISLPAELHI